MAQVEIQIVSIVLNDFRNDSRVLKMAKTLRGAGYFISVAALHRPGLEEEGTVEGVPFRRISLITYRLPRILNFLKFIEMVFKLRFRYGSQDLWIANDFEALVIYSLARLMGCRSKLVYDSHELQSYREGISASKGKFIRRVESMILNHNTVVFNVSPGIVDIYKREFGLKNQKLIMNLPERNKSSKRGNVFREKWNLPDKATVFLIQGRLGANRGLELLLDAFEELEHDLVLVVMGYGPLQELTEEMAGRCENIFFQEAVPHDKIMEYTSSADWGISNVQNTCLNHYHCLPNKIFEYIQAGIPIISNDLGDISNLVRTENLGLVMNGADKEDIKRTMKRAKSAGKDTYEDNLRSAASKYYWGAQESKIVDSIQIALRN